MITIALGILVVALVSTGGDWVWYELGVRHRATAGILHGAVLLTAVGGVIGAAAGRVLRGLPLGAAAGVGGALVYYALAPALGYAAMILAWASLWILLALFDALLLRPGQRSLGQAIARGSVAAILGGLAFWLVVDTLWGRPHGAERSYFMQFLAWAFAWAPGILALTVRAKA